MPYRDVARESLTRSSRNVDVEQGPGERPATEQLSHFERELWQKHERKPLKREKEVSGTHSLFLLAFLSIIACFVFVMMGLSHAKSTPLGLIIFFASLSLLLGLAAIACKI